jgi:polyketide synthase PksM
VLWIAPETRLRAAIDEHCLEEQERGVLAIFRLLKAVLMLGYRDRDLAWTFVTTQTRTVYPHETVDPVHSGVHGLVGSLAKEFPRWKVRLVDLEAGRDLPLRELLSLPFDPQGHTLAHRGTQWLTETLIPVSHLESAPPLYRRGGVYVVIGGAGGIGETWTRWVIEQHQAHVIWIGRRRQDRQIQARLDALSAVGPCRVYIQADASDRAALERAYEAIMRQHHRVHGGHPSWLDRDES